MYRNKIERIILNFEQSAKGPIQGSEEWLQLRMPSKDKKRGRIGGSEVGTLLGVNPYSTKRELMLNKQGKKKNVVDNIMVHLGSLLEEITVMYFEKMFNTKVYCKNISIIDPSKLNDFIFSPDGVALLPRINHKVVLKPMDDNIECCPVLIEIKNPWSRKIVKDGNVPPQYAAQIQAGLMSVPIAHSGLFIDTDTKLCSYDQFFDKGYNKVLHTKSQIKDDAIPLSKGIILFKGTLPQKFWKKDCPKVMNIYDFGNCSYMNTYSIVKECKNGSLSVIYLELYNDNEEEYIKYLKTTIENENAIGFMCYKIYDIGYTICYREPKMISNIRNELNKYSEGELDIDEDYVPKKRKRTASSEKMPNLSFDFDSESDKEKKEKFSFD